MKICKKCGKKLEDSFKFCPNCGQKLDECELKVQFEIKDGKLVDIKRTKGMYYFRTFKDDVFKYKDEDEVYFKGDYEIINFGKWKKMSVINVPDSVNEIPKTFLGKQLLSYSLSLPSSIKKVSRPHFSDSGFYNVSLSCPCSQLFLRCEIYNELNINSIDGIIGRWFLSDCYIHKLVLSSTIKTIEVNAFANCRIDELVIPSSITYWAFGGYNFFDEKNPSFKQPKVVNLIYKGNKKTD